MRGSQRQGIENKSAQRQRIPWSDRKLDSRYELEQNFELEVLQKLKQGFPTLDEEECCCEQ